MIADDKVVHASYFGQFAVAQVEHFTNDGEGGRIFFRDVAQVQQGNQGASIGFLRLQLDIGQGNDVVILGDVEFVKQAAIGGVAGAEGDFLVLQLANFFDCFFKRLVCYNRD